MPRRGRRRRDPGAWARISDEERAEREMEERARRSQSESQRAPAVPAESAREPDERGVRQPSQPPGKSDPNPTKDLMLAMALGFAAVGGTCAAVGIPILAFYVPLGFGVAGFSIALAAFLLPGRWPWHGTLAVAAAVAGIVGGLDAYTEYDDIQDQAEEATEELQDLGF